MIINPNEILIKRQIVLSIISDENVLFLTENKIKKITITIQPKLALNIEYVKLSKEEKKKRGKIRIQLQSNIKSIREQQIKAVKQGEMVEPAEGV